MDDLFRGDPERNEHGGRAMKKEEYLNIMEEQIRCKQARAEVREELSSHIEDQTEAYVSEGIAFEEAERMAVMDMGDPVETGNEMDRIHRPKMDWKSIAAIIGISLTIFVLQYVLRRNEPSTDGAWIPGGDPKYLMINLIGWGVMIAVCYLDYTRIGKYAPQLMTAGCMGILIAGIFSSRVNGYNYFVFVGISISVKMLLLLCVPLYGAILYRYRGQGYRAICRGIFWMLPSLLVGCLYGGIPVSLIVGVTYMVILTVAIYKNWFVVSKKLTLVVLWAVNLIMPLLGGFYIMSQGAAYQKARFQTVLHPYSTEASYQVMTLRKLLAGSRMIGTKAGFLTDAHEMVETGSYVLGMICAYYGMIIAAVLALGIAMLFLRFFRKSIKQKNQLGMIMGTGVSVVFLVELLLYILANAGWLPGVSYCPFMGSGGSGMIVTYILLGILLSVYRHENVAVEIKIKKRMYALRRNPEGEEI